VGAVAGRLVRAFWNARIARHGIFGDMQDALALCLGVLAVLALHAALVGRKPAQGPLPLARRLAREAAVLLTLYVGSLVYSPYGRGPAFWAGGALTALLLRVCLLAVQLCVARAWREPLAGVGLYLVGRTSFTWAYVAGLALRGENSLYALVPLGALVLEVLLVGAVLAVRYGRRRKAQERDALEQIESVPTDLKARVRPEGGS